ncbi:hypothetical protein [Streptomyces sp. NRRL B-24484]|uniref:hypothetical protein n=1 Tax=Streptomyces sp. NRRL B-24484 TaxID=1463833 RepID=UPI0004C13617|nr:hypothetical protein [Streptomyces sp. NRRL B-24484]
MPVPGRDIDLAAGTVVDDPAAGARFRSLDKPPPRSTRSSTRAGEADHGQQQKLEAHLTETVKTGQP